MENLGYNPIISSEIKIEPGIGKKLIIVRPETLRYGPRPWIREDQIMNSEILLYII